MKKTTSLSNLKSSSPLKDDDTYGTASGNYLRANPQKYQPQNIALYQSNNYSSV